MLASHYRPWIGSRYADSRFLVLSESAYDWGDEASPKRPTTDHPEITVMEAISDFDEGTVPAYFVTMTRALCGKDDPTKDERRAAWGNCAYSIYVPESVGYGARTRPTSEHWKKAKGLFPQLIDQLRPKPARELVRPSKILVTGYGAWKNMMECVAKLTDELQACRLGGPDSELTWCLAVPHPTAPHEGTGWQDISQQIALFLATTFPSNLSALQHWPSTSP
jgi:hypothetical protein